MIARPPLAVPLAGLAGFLALLAALIAGWAPLRDADTALSEDLRAYGESHLGLVAAIRVATDVAATTPFLVTGIVVTLALVARVGWPEGALTALVTAAVPALWGLLHWLVHRPRPRDGFVLVDSSGFPSGHTANATAAGLVAVLLLWPRLAPGWRAVVVALAAAFAISIGLTRVLLLAHWPADVLGGWLLALAVVPLAARVAWRSGGPPTPPAVADGRPR